MPGTRRHVAPAEPGRAAGPGFGQAGLGLEWAVLALLETAGSVAVSAPRAALPAECRALAAGPVRGAAAECPESPGLQVARVRLVPARPGPAAPARAGTAAAGVEFRSPVRRAASPARRRSLSGPRHGRVDPALPKTSLRPCPA